MSVPTVPVPSHLGRYEVGAKIGGGGMATVYIGRTTRGNGDEELVALKVIRDEYAHDENFSSMFVDEAKILARLAHPNVIHTLEYGVTGHHRFIAMELLSGRTFADVWDELAARNEAISVRLGAWICARVAEGLHSAHELVDEGGTPLSVIHRDVNPGNVFLTHRGEVKLIDFGLAKARVRLSKSVDGIVKGKIPYLAPEQARGAAIDRRTDIYALGTTLWETATMKRLFKRDTDVATLKAIRDAKVPDVREMIPGFPDPLWKIIERATQIEQDARQATAEELHHELDAFLGDTSDLPGELVDLLAKLFPGQQAQHAKWVRDATASRPPMWTMPPPAPLPTVSSSVLEETDSVPEQAVAPTLEREREPEQAREREREREATEKRSSSKQTTSAKTGSESSNVTRSSRDEATATSDRGDEAAPRRLWLPLAVVIAVLVALALVLSAR
ncbi:serine/threonine protein kinase [Labilithrix luteola]|uniref:Serine/threonine protein kinase n=1 Tax=Labilithrix luteola TaxID=1391654 RepID=A0A0K1Q7F8_9BACT|nr:serine/threonine-protein kinase [Labilithrix luteola]AKV01678.1 serine/threonine protein kinase [Labilithrix luteola]